LNALSVQEVGAKTIFRCEECKYHREIEGVYREKIEINRPKEREQMAAELPEREVVCPLCSGTTAHYYQMQTRSADEPMTIFNTCTRCKHAWRE